MRQENWLLTEGGSVLVERHAERPVASQRGRKNCPQPSAGETHKSPRIPPVVGVQAAWQRAR